MRNAESKVWSALSLAPSLRDALTSGGVPVARKTGRKKGRKMETKRTKQIIIRVSNDEHLHMMAKRGRLRLATWMRETCLRGSPPVIPQSNAEMMAELRKIGTNINQIAHRLNGGAACDMDDLHSEVSALRSALAGAMAE
jgi:hypothetical protein